MGTDRSGRTSSSSGPSPTARSPCLNFVPKGEELTNEDSIFVFGSLQLLAETIGTMSAAYSFIDDPCGSPTVRLLVADPDLADSAGFVHLRG